MTVVQVLSPFKPALVANSTMMLVVHDYGDRAEISKACCGFAVSICPMATSCPGRFARPLFPTLSVRELIANALIHQDMTVSGAGPMIELFADRIEITNPGAPLIDPD